MKITIKSKIVPTDSEQLLQVLLEDRELSDARTFLHPKAPLELTLSDVNINAAQVKKAVARIKQAKENQEKIIVFGDYDCDGVCATTVLWETLYEYGCKVLPFIPNRTIHGYGLSQKAVDEILATGIPSILISVDNGITAELAWKRLSEAGVYTILTDHHEPGDHHPQVDVLIHTTLLCGTSLAWMLAREILRDKSQSLLDLCSLATVADQMPLTGANRSFAKYGLEQLNVTKRLGLKMLIDAVGLKQGEVNTFGLNFGIVPRINAIGRLGHALDALRALCTKDESRAKELVDKLTSTNVERQELTQELVDLARSRASAWEGESVIVIEDESFHEGVIGLIAGRLTEEYHRPSLVISKGELTSKGSARSVPGVHITELLREVSDLLLDVGGHPLAAGFRIETARIEEFKAVFIAKAKTQIDPALLQQTLMVDCKLPQNLINLPLASEIKKLEPFGPANREPLFLFSALKVESFKRVGKDMRHLSLRFELENGQKISAIAFGQAESEALLAQNSTVDVVAALEINEWKGRQSVQLLVKSIST